MWRSSSVTRSNAGLSNVGRPRYAFTAPAIAISVPGGSCFARYGWLNQMTRMRAPASSLMVASVACMRPPRPMRIARARSTVPRIVCSSPTCSAAIGTVFEKSW